MPAPAGGRGLECDKFEPGVASFHFYRNGLILGEPKPAARKAVKASCTKLGAETQNSGRTGSRRNLRSAALRGTTWLPPTAATTSSLAGTRQSAFCATRARPATIAVENFFESSPPGA
jgi:hypothetical protein